jgi:hypothetical protein
MDNLTPPPFLQAILPLLEAGPLAVDAARQLDDPAVLAHLRAQHLGPWVYRELTARGQRKVVSSQFLKALKHDYAFYLRETQRQEGDARAMVAALAAAGIGPILLKGADLRQRVYGEPAVRPMGDLDLLIAPGEIARSQEVLSSRGFRLQPQCLDPRPGFRRIFRNELQFDPPPANSLVIDLHWELRGGRHFYRLPYSALVQKALPWDYRGVPVQFLAPEHLLIHLCLHTASENPGARAFLDLALVLTRLPLDWDTLLSEAAGFGCHYPVFLVLQELAPLLPQAIPAGVLADLGRHRPHWLEKRALNRGGFLTEVLITVYHHPHPRECLLFLAAGLWPSPEYLAAMPGDHSRRAHLRRVLAKT